MVICVAKELKFVVNAEITFLFCQVFLCILRIVEFELAQLMKYAFPTHIIQTSPKILLWHTRYHPVYAMQ